MFCARCGKPLPDGAAFCPSCGAPVASAPDTLGTAHATPQGAAIAATPDTLGTAHATDPAPAATSPGPPPPAPPVVAQAAGAVRYGGFWRRWLAFIIDGLIIGAIMLPFGLSLGLSQLSDIFNEEITAERLVQMIATSFLVGSIRVVVSVLYGAGFESSRFQATPGKMVLGLKVTGLDGGRISFARGIGRQFGKWLSGIILGIGYLLVAFHDRKQGLHDLIAGTLVRRESQT